MPVHFLNTIVKKAYFNGLEWFYLTHETDTNNLWIISTYKQKKTIELVHNGA